MRRLLLLVAAAALLGTAPLLSQTVSLSPAVVALRGGSGQSTTQTMTIANATSMELAFELSALDVVVREGARVFVEAGRIPDSIAATAVFSKNRVRVGPGQRASSDVTLTLPPRGEQRAVVVLFRGTTKMPYGSANATASLGTLLTFTLSDRFSLSPPRLLVQPQSATRNAAFEGALVNDGAEPIVPIGVAVILDEAGRLVARAPFESRRILPGERVTLRAEYPGELPNGRYRVLSTFDYEGRSVTAAAALVVP